MYGILLGLHVIICIALVLSVLLQSAKGEGLAGAFGGTSLTGTVFGGRGAASFLSKATTVLAVAFMSSCIILTFINPSTGTSSALQGTSAVQEAVQEAPPQQAPATTPPGASTTVDEETGQPSTGQPPESPDQDLFGQPATTEQGGTATQGEPAGQETTPDQGTTNNQSQGGTDDQPDQSGGGGQ